MECLLGLKGVKAEESAVVLASEPSATSPLSQLGCGMATDGLDAASPFRLLRDSIGSSTSHNVLFIGDKRTIAEVLNLYLSKSTFFSPCRPSLLHDYPTNSVFQV